MERVAALFKRHGLLLALLAAAVVFYAIGFKKGSAIAIALAMLFEIGFWVRFLGPRRSDRDRS